MTGRRKILTLALLVPIAACGRQNEVETQSDSAFAALQQRGEKAMGVNQYTSQHVFEPLPDGGRIVLQREARDFVGVAAIRAHMDTISKSFANGDFAVPGFVHATGDVPGTAAMKRLKAEITYKPQDLPGGAQVVIATKNSQAISAIHEFLAFQTMDHRAGMH